MVTLEAMQKMGMHNDSGGDNKSISESDDPITRRIKEVEAAEEEEKGKKEEKVVKDKETDHFWEHEFKPGETLMGLALAYGVSGVYVYVNV